MIDLKNIDCMDYMAQCEDNAFDLAIVDPPYGIGEDGKKNHSRGKLAKAKQYNPKNWDNCIPEARYFTELKRVSKNQIIWGGNYFIEFLENSPCWIVWDKLNGDTDFADCELAWTSFKTSVRKIKWKWQGMLQQNMKNKELRIHPTQKPAKIYEWILMKYAKEGDKILDTHLGSASIAIACHDMKFDLVGCEIDQEYFSSAVQRFERHKSQLSIF